MIDTLYIATFYLEIFNYIFSVIILIIWLLKSGFIDQINHNPNITTEDYAYEIKGAGLFSRDLLFSLRTPVAVKAGEQVKLYFF